ncbi:MAG: formylglycine-generating enzyme family protein [Deltaproteobacteria bacterium]|nr:formylglycine-generating enzyme family protein [Deltaproteobacteria bacterium]
MRNSSTWLRLAALAATTAACNSVTGVNDVDLVDKCRGSLCGLCPAGQRWSKAQEMCIQDCGAEMRECGDGCCPSIQLCIAPELAQCGCEAGSTLCGSTCCQGAAPHCITTDKAVQRCSACDTFEHECAGACCKSPAICVEGVCTSAWLQTVSKQSCAGGQPCGPEAFDCCDSPSVVADGEETFLMGRSDTGADQCPATLKCYDDEQPEHERTLSPYSLDRFEVTVERFRKFVDRWDYTPPPDGAGAHPKIAGSGWQSAWNDRLPKTRDELVGPKGLECHTCGTWTAEPGAKELLPVNCVSWYMAFAFCVWDGGRLPTEAEWEYAAANGSKNNLYPWGEDPASDDYAVYNCDYHAPGGQSDCYCNDVAPVGQKPNGANQWGHRDLAGNMFEWVLDSYDTYPATAQRNYANVSAGTARVLRGGAFLEIASIERAAYRLSDVASTRDFQVGLRCAR